MPPVLLMTGFSPSLINMRFVHQGRGPCPVPLMHRLTWPEKAVVRLRVQEVLCQISARRLSALAVWRQKSNLAFSLVVWQISSGVLSLQKRLYLIL